MVAVAHFLIAKLLYEARKFPPKNSKCESRVISTGEDASNYNRQLRRPLEIEILFNL